MDYECLTYMVYVGFKHMGVPENWRNTILKEKQKKARENMRKPQTCRVLAIFLEPLLVCIYCIHVYIYIYIFYLFIHSFIYSFIYLSFFNQCMSYIYIQRFMHIRNIRIFKVTICTFDQHKGWCVVKWRISQKIKALNSRTGKLNVPKTKNRTTVDGEILHHLGWLKP